ncbi:MotA/TolQ/ExbB proton channel family protein [Aureimonas altamirensis]|uniref:MotA/TolQ/ExbB proton channel family protein n=1 Tax=Aureimonas altamirensis TaxID=370622 RepID=UPI001E35D59E|nr:MotA/TolQ/ExbB proton channel family protein [Aureimonas altamirensis]UHD47287.1 MotA/TolQ/ExbB proton channel family protein [Aureimonas altamirensis]
MQVMSTPREDKRPAHVMPERLSSPMVYFWTMAVFLALAGFVALILGRQIVAAFQSNPGLNGMIGAVLAVGIILTLAQILRLTGEVRWINLYRDGSDEADDVRAPVLLAPMQSLLAGRRIGQPLPTQLVRSILDSLASRLDETRDISRYLVGLLVFLGLLGTFWGLLTTIGSISSTIQSLDPTATDAATVLNSVQEGLSAPLAGMGTAFSSSLFGLSGSLILGFLDLQIGRGQNRFYTEVENWLATVTDAGGEAIAVTGPMPLAPAAASSGADLEVLADRITRLMQDQGAAPRSGAAMASLAESIQGLVQHMRSEQQMMRDFVETQAREQQELRRTLDRLAGHLGPRQDRY